MSSTKLHPSVSLKPVRAIEERFEKIINDVKSFINSVSNIKEMITYSKHENKKIEIKCKKYKMVTTKLKSFDTFVVFATTSTSVSLSVGGIGLIVTPSLTGVGCGLTISNKVIYEIVLQNYNKHNKLYERAEQTVKSFDKLCRKCLQDNVIDKKEYESPCNFSEKIHNLE